MLTLISGGARSGKSRHALAAAQTAGRVEERLFIATAEAFDEEMVRRIAAHRLERQGDFQTVEAPLDPASALRDSAGHKVVVLDCLTVWLGNLMYRREQAGLEPASEPRDYPEIVDLLACLDRIAGPAEESVDLFVVTNELGLGLVPADAMSRAFRDLAGRLNQEVARRADRVLFMVSGLPLTVKEPAPRQPEEATP